jgi:ribonuclease J
MPLVDLGLIQVKLREAHIQDADLRTIKPGDVLDVGPFSIEFFHVSHSIPDGVGLGIRTPLGLVVHSGDFKFDHSPVDGHRTDFARLAELGGQGVLLLLSDSTNAERAGYTPSEQVVGEMFSRVFAEAQGRVIVATFASNISRVQQVIETAQRCGGAWRWWGAVCRTMCASPASWAYLTVPDDVLLTIEQLDQLPENQVALICTRQSGRADLRLVRRGTRLQLLSTSSPATR